MSYHKKQSSLPTVYEDPYRVIRKGPKSPEKNSISDSSEFDAVHSRTASDSSTSKLYSGTTTATADNHILEDPYAKSHYKNKKRLSLLNDDRANSYLPYSHHERDPNQKTEPIYIEDDTTETPATTSLGMGSMLNDNFLFSNDSKKAQQSSNIPNHQNIILDLPEMNTLRRKKQMKRYCGLRLRTILFISFIWIAIIVIIWYFVWPRLPTLTLEDIDNTGTTQVITNTTKKIMSTGWTINMTADNSNNWVPTRFKSIDLTIIDDSTNAQFGSGSLTHFSLPGRTQSSLIIPMTIYYATEDANDATFQDLYNACGVQVSSNSPYDNQQDSLNVTFSVTYRISGIVWSTTRYIPYSGISCPTN